MAKIITTLHPKDNSGDDLYPNIMPDNIPDKSISYNKLDNDIVSGMYTFNMRIKSMENILMQTIVDELPYTFNNLSSTGSEIPTTVISQYQSYNVFKDTEIMIHEVRGMSTVVGNSIKSTILKTIEVTGEYDRVLSIEFPNVILRGANSLHDYIEFIKDDNDKFTSKVHKFYNEKTLTNVTASDFISSYVPNTFFINLGDCKTGQYYVKPNIVVNGLEVSSPYDILYGGFNKNMASINHTQTHNSMTLRLRADGGVTKTVQDAIDFLRNNNVSIVYETNSEDVETLLTNLYEKDIACLTTENSKILATSSGVNPDVEVILQVEKVVG